MQFFSTFKNIFTFFQLFVYNFSKKTIASQEHFGLTNMGSNNVSATAISFCFFQTDQTDPWRLYECSWLLLSLLTCLDETTLLFQLFNFLHEMSVLKLVISKLNSGNLIRQKFYQFLVPRGPRGPRGTKGDQGGPRGTKGTKGFHFIYMFSY